MRWFFILCFCGITNSLAALLDKDDASLSLNIESPNPPSEGMDSSKDLPGLLHLLHLRAHNEQPVVHQGSKKIQLCETCHAASLNRYNHYLPLLRGQNLEYLFAKIYSFKTDERSKHPFPPYLRSLSNQDIMDISLFYSNQKSGLNKNWVLSELKNTDQAINDKETGLEICQTCHGSDGKGSQLIPKISGQNKNYLSYRIREIASQSSSIHIDSVAAVKCSISKPGIRESRQMASQLALVLDDGSVKRGERIYLQNCANCHDQGLKGAPKLSDTLKWQQRVRQGWDALVESTVQGKAKMPYRGGNWFLSQNQLTDAIHFMISKIVTNDFTAEF